MKEQRSDEKPKARGLESEQQDQKIKNMVTA